MLTGTFTSGRGINRRGFLRCGSLGLGGLSLAQLLELRANAAEQPTSRSRAAVIFLELAGGPTQFETYDPKPDAPEEYRGPLGTVATCLSGVRFSELMVEQAKIADKLAVIRSIHHDSSSHSTSAHLTQTGYYLRNQQSRDNEMPSLGSITSRARGPNEPGMPAYVALPRPTRHGQATWLGKAFNPFVVDGDPSESEFQVRNLALEDGLNMVRLNDRRSLLGELDAMRRLVDGEGVSSAIDQFTKQAFSLLTTERAQQAFDLQRETESTREKYGQNPYGQSLLLARRLVEAGVTLVTARMSYGWDDHGQIARAMGTKGPIYDRAVAALISDLYDRGLDRDVMVVATGEFGRTPRVNKNAGRDHWGQLMSVMMAGGGLRVGQIVGSSNANGEIPKDSPYRPENVLATVYRHLGIDTHQTFVDFTGRPRYVLERHEVISELI